MVDSETTGTAPAETAPRRRRAASRPVGPPTVTEPAPAAVEAPAEPAVTRRRTRKAAAKAVAAEETPAPSQAEAPAEQPAPEQPAPEQPAPEQPAEAPAKTPRRRASRAAAPAVAPVLFQAPVPTQPAPVEPTAEPPAEQAAAAEPDETAQAEETDEGEEGEEGAPRRRRRRRGGRGRRRGTAETGTAETGTAEEATGETAPEEAAGTAEGAGEEGDEAVSASRRRRRRRRRTPGEDGEGGGEDNDRTVVHVREPRAKARGGHEDEPTSLRGSTRLEAKKQRRREGRDAGRRRPPILTEAEFLSRREAVNRVMAVRQRGPLTQIGVLEDDILVEHYVASAASTAMVGNVYLGKVQNVLPSMEAAFVDIGRGRNAVLYAGEVNWDTAGLADGQPRRIEHALKSGDSVLVQVTKDPIGHKGARLTSNVSLAGRFLVYVPDGSMSGISRKLPDTERNRLKGILKSVVPEDAGVIVRTAAEGASEEQLTRDVQRLHAQWEDIQKKAKTAAAPALLYGEPDLTVRVVRDLFNEDIARLVVSGDDAWDVVEAYVSHVAPDLMDRVDKHVGPGDLFHDLRIDEQLAKALDRKVWLPSGGSLVIDRTEAMTVVDVNTGKFTGKGVGNLEETVTKNNLEAAEEIVRQLRLRDIGGIIVIDFIDMVLESNRELVLRRLTECLGRDRTKHQVAEVTSLGLVQMTRKRIGQGLLEAFSEPCEHCNGRGLIVQLEPVEHRRGRSAESAEAAAAAPKPRRSRAKKAVAAEEPAAG